MDVWFYTYGCGYAPPGWAIQSLPYTNRVYVVLGGRAFFLSDAGERPLLPGWLYLFPHRLPFRVRQEESDRIFHMYFDFMLAPPLLGETLVEMPVEQGSLLAHTVECLRRTVHAPGDSARAADGPLVYGYFTNLLRLIFREHPDLPLSDERMTGALRRIHEEFARPLTDEVLARTAHMEKNHFIRVFRRATGMTPHQYLRECRLNRAIALLKAGETVSRAAQACGYETASSLSAAMVKSRGARPGEVRRGEGMDKK